MTTAGILWPTKDEYDLAIVKWTETLGDADLRSGTLACDKMGICRFGGANLYVCIYKIGNWMVRCFCSKSSHLPPPDIQERYRTIERFCHSHASHVSALIPVSYIEQGIALKGRTLPIVKMPFLAGCPSLGEFIMDHYQERETMQRLSDAWLLMIRELEAVPMAHGDLDLSNVLVELHPSHLTLKLIDYDNFWIPELADQKQTEYGHNNFQHPSFLPPHQRPYNAEMDRFSALVIYIALKTLCSHPELYEQWGADESDRLLLSETDYENAGLADSRIVQLRTLSNPELRPYIDELNAALREKCMPRNLDSISYEPLAPQPVEIQMPAIIQPPAHSIWIFAVYNPNDSLPASSKPPVPTWSANGFSHLGERDESGAAMNPWGSQPHAPTASGYNGLIHHPSTNPAKKSRNTRRLLVILAICLLSLIIVVVIIALVIIFVTSLQGATTTSLISAHSRIVDTITTINGHLEDH